jgi:hypothetical protein
MIPLNPTPRPPGKSLNHQVISTTKPLHHDNYPHHINAHHIAGPHHQDHYLVGDERGALPTMFGGVRRRRFAKYKSNRWENLLGGDPRAVGGGGLDSRRQASGAVRCTCIYTMMLIVHICRMTLMISKRKKSQSLARMR